MRRPDMAKLYANENFRRRIVEALREMGHDVLTTSEAGNANLAISDDEVLNFAIGAERIILTFNRKDFIRLHRLYPTHLGIIVCTEDNDYFALASRIHEAILTSSGDLTSQLIRVNRPNLSDLF